MMSVVLEGLSFYSYLIQGRLVVVTAEITYQTDEKDGEEIVSLW